MPECNKSVDRRTLSTKQFFLKALESLLMENNYQDITIQKLCTRAGRSRETFARNFKSIDELLKMLFENLHHQILASLELDHIPEGKENYTTLLTSLLRIDYFLQTNQDKYNPILKHDLPGLGIVFGCFSMAVANSIKDVYMLHQKFLPHLPKNPTIACLLMSVFFININFIENDKSSVEVTEWIQKFLSFMMEK